MTRRIRLSETGDLKRTCSRNLEWSREGGVVCEYKGRRGPDHIGPVGRGLGTGLGSRCCGVPLQALSRVTRSDLGRDVQSSLGVRGGELALALG